MTKELKIFCKNTNEYVAITGGESLNDIFQRIKGKIHIVPICARVNNKTEDLQYPVFSPKHVEFLERDTPSGSRVYIRSLCMIMYKAIVNLYPDMRLRVEHSISRGYYCRLFSNSVEITPEVIDNIKAEMQNIIEQNISFIRHEKLTTDVIELFRKAGLNDKVTLLESSHELYTVYYTLGNVADSYYGNLAPSTACISVFNLIPYKKGALLLGPDSANRDIVATPIAQEKMYKAFTDHLDFNRVIGVDDVGNLNKAVAQRQTAMLINVAEALHDKMIGRISDEITERFNNGGARVVLIAGPSSSGKTTTTKRLAIHLMTNLIRPKMISLDDYFVNREDTPLDENGEYDYESLYALDINSFNNDLKQLIEGQEVSLPTYNFELGRRLYKGNKIKLEKNDILLIEGIHGLNPELTAQIPEEQKFRLFVSALTTLSIDDHNWVPTTDNRLLRRIIRDFKYRGVSAKETIARWQSVRRGEEKWIFPYQENADATFNSSLLFELGVMKEYAYPILRQVAHDVPEYAEANRLLMFLSYFESISEKQIPSTSLLREFLGGSSFKY
ncbi:MAG: nucleoside kinase [Muribaculaceae bacterium]